MLAVPLLPASPLWTDYHCPHYLTVLLLTASPRGRQIHRFADRQTDRQTGRQADRQVDRQAGRQTGRRQTGTG